MSNKRQRDEYQDRSDLNSAGWQVEKPDSVRFNGGSETKSHLLTKTAAAYVLRGEDYRISSEVEHDEYGEIDVLAYAGDGKPFAVECESNLTREVKSDKITRYVKSNEVIRDCLFLEVSDAPDSFSACCEWVRSELF